MTSPAPKLDSLFPPRRERNAAETKRRLLDAAEAEFAAKGFDGARLASIARAVHVQQALIHHYFSDKAGLYREVLTRALGQMTDEGWGIIERLAPKKKKRYSPADLRDFVGAFAELLVRFYATHGNVVAILRHEAQRGGPFAPELVGAGVKAQFEEIAARLEGMRARGEIRKDVDPRHVCISAMAMASFPFAEERFLASFWAIDPYAPSFLEERKREILEMVLARILP